MIEVHEHCGGRVRLVDEAWRCERCGTTGVAVDQVYLAPDLVGESGRETLPMSERADLLAAEVEQLASAGPRWHPGISRGAGMDVHDWNSFIGQIRDVITCARRGHSTEANRGRWCSEVECLVLAWRRAGLIEWKVVRDLHRKAGKVPR